MCWSADADLVAGTVIMTVGVGCLAGVRRARDVPLAALPVLLGLHQVVESVVWRGVDDAVSAGTADTAHTLWAVIAFPLLPLLVPSAVLLASSPTTRSVRRRLQSLAVVGAATSAILAVTMVRHPVSTRPLGHTLGYSLDVPVVPLVIAGYLAATLGALLIAPDPAVRTLGVVTVLGAAVCYLVWELAFASTWCAVAAAASLILLRWAWQPRPAAGACVSCDR